VPTHERPHERSRRRRTRTAVTAVVAVSVVALVGVPMLVLGENSGAMTPFSVGPEPARRPPVPTAAPTTVAPQPPVDTTTDPPAATATAAPAVPADPALDPAADESSAPSAADQASPSGEAAPVGDLPGWTQTFVDDFDTPVDRGSFPGPYASSWLPYDGFTDTADIGTYRASAISVADGMLSLGVSALGDDITSSAVVPLVDGRWGGTTYGRYSVRLRSDPVPGYSAAFLLWSDENDWDDGEIDFPEGHLDKNVRAYNHTPGDPAENSFARRTAVPFSEWHTYTIEWKPDEIVFSIDGVPIGTTRSDIPTATMHWVMQIETSKKRPPEGVAGAVQVDWAAIYRYDG
jgi:beta-glucanase (GH16 family)